MIIGLIAFLAAIGFEWAGFALLLTATAPLAKISFFLLLHLLASFSIAIAVWPWIPDRYRRPRTGTFAFLVVFSMFAPGLGACGIVAYVLAARLSGVRAEYRPLYCSLRLADYGGGAATPPPDYGAGGFRSRLFGKGVADHARMATILLVQALPGRLANRLWRSLLSDRLDDMRLMAYQTLDMREKGLNRSICERDQRLARERDPAVQALLIRQLVELNWEMLYDDLAQGAVADFIGVRLGALLRRGLEADPENPDLWLLQGRLALWSADLSAAEHAFVRSLEQGMPRSRVVPYMAELAFERGEWKRARQLMRSIRPHRLTASFSPQAAMWQDRRPCR